MAPQILQQSLQTGDGPRYWFDEQRNPAVVLGPIAFPAYILPLLLCSGVYFVPPRQPVRRPVLRDVSVMLAGMQFEDGDPRQLLVYMIAIFHVAFTGPTLSMDYPAYGEWTANWGFAQAAVLLVTGSWLDPTVFWSCLWTALGWIVFPLHDGRPGVAAVAAVLALPCACQCLRLTGLAQQYSGILLLRAALEAEPAVQSLLATMGLSRIAPVTYFFLIWLRVDWRTARTDLSASSSLELGRKLPFGLASFASYAVPMVVGSLATVLSISCIGWTSFVSSEPAESLFFHPIVLIFGVLGFLGAWAVIRCITGDSKKPADWKDIIPTACREAWFCFHATGWMCVVIVGLWWTLVIVRALEVDAKTR